MTSPVGEDGWYDPGDSPDSVDIETARKVRGTGTRPRRYEAETERSGHRLFLAHSSADRPIVRELFQLLALDGFEPWLDEDSLLVGQNSDHGVREAIRYSDAMVVFLSSNGLENDYVNQHISRIMTRGGQTYGGGLIIPIKLEDCEVPARLARIHPVVLSISDDDFSIGATYLRLQVALIFHAASFGHVDSAGFRAYRYGMPPGSPANFPTAKRACDWQSRYSIKGGYLVRGRNPDGSKYYGTASIDAAEDVPTMQTVIGHQVFDYPPGTWRHSDRSVSFEGRDYTVTYTRTDCGTLLGTWGRGGVEELIPASPLSHAGVRISVTSTGPTTAGPPDASRA
ncbi:toll/interleukin-1 receptor domain-containing protein [Nocardia sp. NPDC050710]|uniref:toll/interleukin-1 receptor domain-containing protein n=1 Tax=Nocardia sp. NPDC050710 TaxID=3157220 RepID=UPI0033F244DE